MVLKKNSIPRKHKRPTRNTKKTERGKQSKKNMEITIQNVIPATKKDGTPYYKVTNEKGMLYSVWNDGEELKTGMKIEAEIKTVGNYNNINSFSITETGITTPTTQTSIATDKQNSIIAQCLTKILWEQTTQEKTQEKILETYKWYLENI